MKNWYRIQAKGPTSAEVLIYDEIGMFGISAKTFIADLKALGSVNEITLGINSPGGDVFDGIAIYNALKRHPARITGRVDGIAASIASVILMAADHVVMPDNSMLMIHNPWGGVLGDAEDMREFADALDKIKIAILAAYRRSGKSDEQLSAIMDVETWFTADEAKAAGFADEVVASVDIAAFFDLGKYQKAPAALKSPPAPPDPAAIAADIAPTTPMRFETTTVTIGDRSESKTVATPIAPLDEAAFRLQARKDAVEILSLCAKAGFAAAAASFLEEGLSVEDVKAKLAEADPEKLRSAQASWISEELKSIHALCVAAGVADLSEKFINEGRPLAWVEDRLKDAQRIRAICCASKLPTWQDRAANYIRAGVTLEEARDNLFKVLLALDVGEIDNRLGPDIDGHAGNNNRQNRMSVSEIYAQRNRPRDGAGRGRAEELGRKLANVIQEHGQLR